MHKTIPDVAAALKKPKKEADAFFEAQRKQGIYVFNLKALAKDVNDGSPSVNLMREKKSKHEVQVKMCKVCRAFISAKNFFSHKSTCKGARPVRMDIVPGFEVQTSKDFEDNILSKFHNDDVGEFCRKDKVICIVGYRHYMYRKHDTSKRCELRKAIMAEMRELARLFFEFQKQADTDVTTFDMFKREHLNTLLDAIDTMTRRDDVDKPEKHGLKLNLNAVLMKSIATLGGYFCQQKKDADEEELNRFKRAYQYRAPERFSGARFQCAKNSMDKHRRPEELPVMGQMYAVRTYINTEIAKVLQNFTMPQYTWLRSLVVTRLTLYNGRRGEEGARLQLKELQDALDGVWLPPEHEVEVVQDEAEKYLKGQYLLAYLSSKGKKKFVPLLIPKDLCQPIQILVDHRTHHGIDGDNTFVFATRGDANHCYGWAATNEVSTKAGYTITATANRHRLSTIYASLEMSAHDRKTYLDHMGHQEGINQNVYQCPLGFKVLRVMGPTLDSIDQGMLN